jgi:murein DD-endopeptidase MepM/ murein hydrolase activator NlpD
LTVRVPAAVAALLLVSASAAQPQAQSAPEIRLSGDSTPGGLLILQAPRGTTRLLANGLEVPQAPDGRYLVGLGRDEAGPLKLEAIAAARRLAIRTVELEPRTWRVQRLPALGTTDTPEPAWVKRRAAEQAELGAAKGAAARAPAQAFGWSQPFIRPASGRITGVYGSQRVYGGLERQPHTGLDIANAIGTPVRAPADGIVRLATGPFLLEGNMVLLDHGAGLVTSYMHLSEILVRPGQALKQGQPIGRIGTTGRSTGPHLHWGMSLVRPQGQGHSEVRLDPRLRLGGR